MRKFSVVLAASGLLTFSALASSELLVSDSFESRDMSTSNEIGFWWADTKKSSVVNATTRVYDTELVNEPAPEDSQWEAKTGDHALLLRYLPGESWFEQHFRMTEPQPEIWMSYWLRVPTNYAHPTVDSASDNQKLFRLWMDGYGKKGEGTTVGMSFRGNGNGGSNFFAKINSGDYSHSSPDKGSVPFISVPGDRGKWMHLVVHVKSESVADANDGLMEVWRRWEGDSDYTKTHEFFGQPIKISSTKKGFAAGYLMGWANAPYPVTTDFLIDDFELATSPLFSDSIGPNPPSEIAVQ